LVFIDIKSFDPRTHNSGSASVKTGNLFTRSGNGDDHLTFRELIENLGIITASSGVIHEEISQSMDEARCTLPQLDVFGNNYNHESCFHQVIRANYHFYFSHMPHLIAYLDTLNPSQF